MVSPETHITHRLLSNPLQNQVPDQLTEDLEGSWDRE